MIKKVVLFLGTAFLTLNAFAVSFSDLNSAMGKMDPSTTALKPAKMIYGGKDVITPKQISEYASLTTVS